jgi:cytochrome c oxidase subunit 3
MATTTVKVVRKKPRPHLGGGDRGPVIRFPDYGGGGGGRDDSFPDFGERLRRYRLGLGVGLASVVMLFVSFTSAYIVRQGLGTWDTARGAYVSDWQPLPLPTGLLLVNTLLLLASSFTIEKARRQSLQLAVVAPITEIPGIAADEKPVPWLPITVVLGMGFLAGQLLAWREMAHRGYFLASNPSSSFFYVLTGAHGLHLAGGIVALLYALAATHFRTRPLERRRIVVDITAWYWHFMGVLWIYVFALLKFAS